MCDSGSVRLIWTALLQSHALFLLPLFVLLCWFHCIVLLPSYQKSTDRILIAGFRLLSVTELIWTMCFIQCVEAFPFSLSGILNFCANNYLGLSSHPEVVQAGIDALKSYGAGLSSVRFICGTQV